MTYSVTRLSTGKVEHIRAGRADDALRTYKGIRVAELNAEYAGAKVVNTSRIIDNAKGGYVLHKEGNEVCRFDLGVKTVVLTKRPVADYQDATQADWQSGKFHN